MNKLILLPIERTVDSARKGAAKDKSTRHTCEATSRRRRQLSYNLPNSEVE